MSIYWILRPAVSAGTGCRSRGVSPAILPKEAGTLNVMSEVIFYSFEEPAMSCVMDSFCRWYMQGCIGCVASALLSGRKNQRFSSMQLL